jgi:hypothetical protein
MLCARARMCSCYGSAGVCVCIRCGCVCVCVCVCGGGGGGVQLCAFARMCACYFLVIGTTSLWQQVCAVVFECATSVHPSLPPPPLAHHHPCLGCASFRLRQIERQKKEINTPIQPPPSAPREPPPMRRPSSAGSLKPTRGAMMPHGNTPPHQRQQVRDFCRGQAPSDTACKLRHLFRVSCKLKKKAHARSSPRFPPTHTTELPIYSLNIPPPTHTHTLARSARRCTRIRSV